MVAGTKKGNRTPQEEGRWSNSARSRKLVIPVAIAAVIIVGLVGRSLVAGGAESSLLSSFLPWLAGTPVTLYLGDTSGDHLVPVSRTLSGDEESVSGLVEQLLAGPREDTPLTSHIPAGTTALSVRLDGATVSVDLSDEYLAGERPLVDEALVQSLMTWPGVEEVEVSVDGRPLDVSGSPGHLLYFYDRSLDMLVASATAAETTRDIVAAYLAGPEEAHLAGLPDDVAVVSLEAAPGSGLVRLNLTFSPSVREFAIDDGDAMRRVLEGLIATLTTGFRTDFVYLDFEGHASLGLGQCANLLRRVQPQPEILNDERLLTTSEGV